MYENPASQGKCHVETQDANLKIMKNEYLDLLDEYFSGSLEGREKQELEHQLETESDLKDAYREYRDLRDGIDYSIMMTANEELQELEATLPKVAITRQAGGKEIEISIKNRMVVWKAAAVVALVAISTVLVFQLNQTASPQDLFSQHFEPYPNEFVSAKRGDDLAANPLVQAFQNYDNEHYAAAIEGFNQIILEEENAMALFYLGNAQMAQNQTQAAIATFKRFLEISRDSVTEAKWYLALSYLKENRVEEAKELLEELKGDVKYGKEVREIIAGL